MTDFVAIGFNLWKPMEYWFQIFRSCNGSDFLGVRLDEVRTLFYENIFHSFTDFSLR